MEKEFPRAFVDIEAMQSEGVRVLRDKEPPAEMPFDITRIGHVVLNVRDIERSADFYIKVLGFKVSDVYPETMLPGRMIFLRLNADHHGIGLVGGNKIEKSLSELHHMAFQVETLDEVFRARNHLDDHGVRIEFEGRRRGGCQVAIEFRDPDGNFLEIYWGLDQIGPGEDARGPEEWCPVPSLEDAIDNAPPGQDMTLSDPSLRRG